MVTERPLASRIAPSDAAAIPFPREDTTPPVMKIYRAISPDSFRLSSANANTTVLNETAGIKN